MNGDLPRPDWFTCSDCQHRSSCKTARRCAVKHHAEQQHALSEQQVEAAARELCRMRGQDADEQVMHGMEPDAGGIMRMALASSPRWKLAAEEVKQHQQRVAAVTVALSRPA